MADKLTKIPECLQETRPIDELEAYFRANAACKVGLTKTVRGAASSCFSREELASSNVKGNNGKPGLDASRVSKLVTLAMKYFTTTPGLVHAAINQKCVDERTG